MRAKILMKCARSRVRAPLGGISQFLQLLSRLLKNGSFCKAVSQPNPDPRTSGTTQPPKLKALEAPRIRSKDCNFESFDLLCISIPLTNTTDDYIYLDTSFNK